MFGLPRVETRMVHFEPVVHIVTAGQLVFKVQLRGPEKDRKPDPTGPIWTGPWLRLPPIFGWMNRLQPPRDTPSKLPRDTPSKYLQNAPKNIENDQDLNTLLNFY